MKTAILTLMCALGGGTIGFAQAPDNKKSETKVVVTTIKDSEGEKKIIKTYETNEVQKIALGEEKPNTINIPQVDSPVKVTSTTQLSVDGNVKEVEKTSYYVLDGVKYQIQPDKTGYIMSSPNSRGILRKTSNNNYIYVNGEKVAVGYYDKEGSFILETYDVKTDTIKQEKFEVVK